MPVPRRLGALLLLLMIVLAAALLTRRLRAPSQSDTPPPIPGLSADAARALVQRLEILEQREQHANQTCWAPELLAQRHGALLDELWNTLNATPNKLETLRDTLTIPILDIPSWTSSHTLGNGITARNPAGPGLTLDSTAWRTTLQRLLDTGWQLARVELRHVAFATNRPNTLATSRYNLHAWLEHPPSARRTMLEGPVTVHWASQSAPDGSFPIARIDAANLTLMERSGPVPFRQTLLEIVAPPERSHFIDPLLVHDLNHDGQLEIILAAANRRYQLQPDGSWTATPFCLHPPGLLMTAVLGDFNGDAYTDYLVARRDGLLLYPGTRDGRFDHPPQPAWTAPHPIRYGQVLTCADIDADGDLDVWLGQYKTPYERGQMPTPYHDANDGYPSFLLRNEGQGRFADVTADAGLATRRQRRTYSASFANLNGDHHPDLLVVSDFAGADLYLNDGHGHFHDARSWFPDPLGFGMAHTLADLDRDGLIDLLMTGMHCPGATRLDSLGLARPGFERLDAFRQRMTRGNRLYLGTTNGFRLHPPGSSNLAASIANSGWSWSCPAADFDNNGSLDVYIANGHETRQSVVDYEPEFWLHDIYLATSQDDLTTAAYFGAKFGRTRGRGMSYGGYEANRLFLHHENQFHSVSWLLGVGVEQDSRNAVAADLDADGRPDLITTTFEAWPEVRQTVRVLRNELTPQPWIGIDLAPTHAAPFTATITADTSTGPRVHLIVAGDSHRTQSPWRAHFGLGANTQVNSITVQWPDGQTSTLPRPNPGQYHRVEPPTTPAQQIGR